MRPRCIIYRFKYVDVCVRDDEINATILYAGSRRQSLIPGEFSFNDVTKIYKQRLATGVRIRAGIEQALEFLCCYRNAIVIHMCELRDSILINIIVLLLEMFKAR